MNRYYVSKRKENIEILENKLEVNVYRLIDTFDKDKVIETSGTNYFLDKICSELNYKQSSEIVLRALKIEKAAKVFYFS